MTEKEIKIKIAKIIDEWTERHGLETSIDMEQELVERIFKLKIKIKKS